ncbi:phosphotransferase enzyme family protein [Peribacillus sp. SCS-155]|uniref:phosphotransferase enzyme family protein n=1 Tax=Peribacillus sedimenti TaxID=3115297 RepID=UPI0039066EEC
MEKAVEQVFTNEILAKGATLFGVAPEALEKIGDFESYLYSGLKDGEQIILRFTHSSHRSYEQMFAEVSWVKFLKEEGVNVYRHFSSSNNSYIESLRASDRTEFYAVCIEKLPGKQISWRDIENDPHYAYEWGAVIGKLHKITRNYSIPDHSVPRPEWDEEELFHIENYKHDIGNEVLEYRNKVLKDISNLPRNEHTYGLIHSDLHSGNFHVHEGEIYLFDFDDCSYHFFASDIAIPLYYILFSRDFHTQQGRQEFAESFFNQFVSGYRSQNELPEQTLDSIPLFLRLRDIVLLSVLYKKFDFENLSQHEQAFFEAVKKRVENQEVIISF